VDDTPSPRYSYFVGDFDYAVHKGAILIQIVGNPFNVPDNAFRNVALAHMQGQNRGKPAKFVTVPDTETLPPFKVVAAFDMPANIDGYDLCKGPAALPVPPKQTGQVTLNMAFCYGDQLKSDARGWVYDLRRVDDPRFASLVKQVTLAMIPTGDKERMFQDDNNRSR
jgi:hypothetical protein